MEEQIIIYHNPRCKKSREGLNILKENGINPEIVEYLKTPPSEEELGNILEMLDMKPLELIRKNEKIFKENYKGQDHTDKEWIKIMAENPKLIKRPVVIKKNHAVLGRPPEKIKNLL